MFEKLVALWKSASDATKIKHDYIIYAPNKDTFAGFRVNKEYSHRIINRTIAHRENNHPTRQSPGIIMPGSFNFMRIKESVDIDQAISKAKTAGLKYEPLKVVLSRHINAVKDLQNTENAAGKTEMEKILKDLSGLDLSKGP